MDTGALPGGVDDGDGDGVPDATDSFPSDPAEWFDTDGDGLGNNVDLDDDGDGMSDAWEIQFGLDPSGNLDAALDPDRDGVSNLEEYLNGTNPLVALLPVGQWFFDAGEGDTAFDSAGFGNHGVLIGPLVWSAEGLGGSLDFGGGGEHVAVADDPAFNALVEITLAAWIRPRVVGTQYIVKKAENGNVDGYELSLSQDGRAFVRFNHASFGNSFKLMSQSAYPSNGQTWLHLAATYDGQAIRLYVNGKLESSMLAPGLIIGSNALDLIIGAGHSALGAFDGIVDAVEIYDLAANEADIQGMMADGDRLSDIDGGGGGGCSLTPADYTIAFIADQDAGSSARKVLELIRGEQADAVVHSRDFDYRDEPGGWDQLIVDTLGEDFPYFASVGNHDDDSFYGSGGYQDYLQIRMDRFGISSSGDLGVQSAHVHQGIQFVMTASGVFGGDDAHGTYIRDRLAASNHVWRVSSWHKNMNKMQVGGKGDGTGWDVYRQSRIGGAIIATGHEHSYSRTHLFSNIENQTVASTSNTLTIAADDPDTAADEGRTFVFVSGLAGRSFRDQQRGGDWWASIYTKDQNSKFGALFGVFHVDGDPRKAHFYFKNIDGSIVDEFFVVSEMGEVVCDN